MLNKPRGVVSTMSDPQGRRTLADLVSDLDDEGRIVERLSLRGMAGAPDGALVRADRRCAPPQRP